MQIRVLRTIATIATVGSAVSAGMRWLHHQEQRSAAAQSGAAKRRTPMHKHSARSATRRTTAVRTTHVSPKAETTAQLTSEKKAA